MHAKKNQKSEELEKDSSFPLVFSAHIYIYISLATSHINQVEALAVSSNFKENQNNENGSRNHFQGERETIFLNTFSPHNI